MNRTRWDVLLREYRGGLLYVRVSDEEPLVLIASGITYWQQSSRQSVRDRLNLRKWRS